MTLNKTLPCSVFGVALTLKITKAAEQKKAIDSDYGFALIDAKSPAENKDELLTDKINVSEKISKIEKQKNKISRSRKILDNSVCENFTLCCKETENALELFRKAIGAVFADWEAIGVAKGILQIETQNLACLGIDACDLAYTLSETISFVLYRFERDFQGKALKEKPRSLKEVECIFVHEEHLGQKLVGAFELGISNGLSFQKAREWGDCPANILTPHTFTLEMRERLADLHVDCAVFDEHVLAEKGFGGILAVGKGSANPPRLAILEYTPKNTTNKTLDTVVLVGKAVTFDTGGYSIKPKAHHNEMKYDMCGAANIVAAFECLVKAEIEAKLVALIPCAENMVSERAQRPGDVYRAYNGASIDVFNTDAEGRLLLADALAFAGSFSPQLIIDLATLTGGTSQIAGSLAAIVCTNQDEMIPAWKNAARFCGERFLQLEILPEAIDDMKGHVTDYANMNTKWSTGAMTMYAAAFLQEFVPQDTPWLHLDIANMAWGQKSHGYILGSGANSYGARTLFQFLRRRYGCGKL